MPAEQRDRILRWCRQREHRPARGRVLDRAVREFDECYPTVWTLAMVTDRIVAVKVLPAHFGDNEEFQERFRREAFTASRLNTPHVVPIHTWERSASD
jgi:serine/threonine protein kinase